MIIDSHAHVYRHPVPFVVKFCSQDELLRRYDEAGVDKGILMPIVSSEIYLPQSNEDILEICAAHPDRFIPFCNIDPRALTNSCFAPLGDVIRYYKDLGCKGIGEIMPNMSLEDPKVLNLFRYAEEEDMPVTFDGSDRIGGDFGLYDLPGIPYFEHTLVRFPKLRVIAHGPIFWRELGKMDGVTLAQRKPVFNFKGDYVASAGTLGKITEEGVVPRLFRLYPQLMGELSDAFPMLNADDEFGPKFLTEFQDRLFYGSDICFAEHPFYMLGLLNKWRDEGRITQLVYDKICGENARRYFQI